MFISSYSNEGGAKSFLLPFTLLEAVRAKVTLIINTTSNLLPSE